MGVGIGSGTLGERSQEQRVVLLSSETCHADEQNMTVCEALSRTPFFPWGLGTGIAIHWNTVRDHVGLLNPIKALQASGYLFCKGYGDNAVVECIALNPARPVFNLAFRHVVD